jgi:hypothetical protein
MSGAEKVMDAKPIDRFVPEDLCGVLCKFRIFGQDHVAMGEKENILQWLPNRLGDIIRQFSITYRKWAACTLETRPFLEFNPKTRGPRP